MEEPETHDYKLDFEKCSAKSPEFLDFGKYRRKRYAISQPTLFLLRPHTSNMDKHRILRYDLHIFFADACPSNATLCRGHKYTLTYFFSYNNR